MATFRLPGVALALIAHGAVAQSEPPRARIPRAEADGSLRVACATDSPRLRISPDGRWLVLAHDNYRDAGRKAWSIRRFTLVDLVRRRVVLEERNAFPGRTAPVFGRDGRSLVWCNGFDPDAVELHRVRLGDEIERVQQPLDVGLSKRSYPSVCAIDGDTVVLFDGGAERGAETLLVHDLAADRTLLGLDEFREPGYGRRGFDVALVGRHLLSHTRPKDRASGASYRLVRTDVRAEREPIRMGAYVSNATPRYVVSRDGRTLWNGTGRFEIEEVDLESGAIRQLMAVRKPLYSHFLELSVSPDENFVVAWSRERKVLVTYDRKRAERVDIELDRSPHVAGFDRDSEFVLLANRDRGLDAVALRAPHAQGEVIDGEHAFVRVGPHGRRAVTAREVDGKTLELTVWRLR